MIRHPAVASVREAATIRRALAVTIFVLLLGALVLTVLYSPPSLGPGTIAEEPESETYVSAHGLHSTLDGRGDPQKPVRLVGIAPNGSLNWEVDRTGEPGAKFYDTDVLDNGDLLVTLAVANGTEVYRYDPQTGERVWEEQFDIVDTHDVDLINDDELLVANILNDTPDGNGDGVFIYNRTEDRITWHWYFRNHFSNSTAGGISHDWTHVNDIDKIDEGQFMASPRNFDQVVAINRSTKEVDWRLGADDDYDVMFEQHNPQYLETADGNRAVLIADSLNDRVVEYTYLNGSWELTWQVGVDQLSWPRDADRLPNGNTLITDTHHQRVIEVTPTGEIVWEYYVPWAPYDATRQDAPEEQGGPTMHDMNVSGSYSLSGSSGDAEGTGGDRRLLERIESVGAAVPVVGRPFETRMDWMQHHVPWNIPYWLPIDAATFLAIAAVLTVGWALGEVGLRRRAIVDRLGSLRG
jgi:outer membrane protein assembly factor BamB